MQNSKLCLFRIETPSVGSDAGETKLEKKANKVSFLKSQGATLKYGQEVMLRHVHSNRFLSLDLLLASQTPGAWSVTVNDPKESLCRQISLQPFNRSHNIGDPIKFRDPVSIVFPTENLKYFLQSEVLRVTMMDVNATHKPAGWRFFLFEGHDASPEVLKFGETVTIKYTKMGMMMALQKEKPPTHRARDRNVSNSALLQAAQRKLPGDVRDDHSRMPIVTKAEVEDFSHYWIVQNDNAMMGGAVSWKSRFFIKNALTGQVLGPNLTMQSNPDPSYAFFFPKPDSFKEDSLIPNRYPLLLKTKDEKVLAPDSKKSSEEALDHLVPIVGNESQWESGEVGLTLEVLGQDQRESLFEFDYVSERESIFFNLINSLYPKFVELKEKLEKFQLPAEQVAMSTWEATELLEKTLKTMLNALENVSKHIRSAQGDEQETLQKIFAGLGFHAILIEIASILHALFDQEKTMEIANDFIVRTAKKDLEAIWTLLNDVALENETAARKISEHQAFLCELLKYDTERIGSLLNEVFRLVDPEIKDPKQFYHQWCCRLENLTSQNIEEQTIFMRIIRNLCEIGDVGMLEYQTEITRHLFDSEIAIDLVIFGSWQGDVSVRFGAKNGTFRSAADFKAANSRLESALKEDLDGNCVVLLRDLHAFEEYVEYVQTALMLYHSLCKGRCELARGFVRERLGISIETAIDVSQSMSVHIDIRRSFVFLLEALCITVAPFEQYNEQDTSFSFADIKILEANPPSRQPIFNSATNNEHVLQCLKIVFEFWMVKRMPNAIARQQRVGQLHYLMAMLRLTLAVVDFKHCAEMYALLILRTVQYLLVGFTGAAELYKAHWAAEIIMMSVREGAKDRKIKLIVNELLGAVLSTVLAIKKSGRRLVLMQVLAKFINESRHLSNPVFSTGILEQKDFSRMAAELRECVESDRDEKLINDFLRRIDRSRRGSVRGATSATPLLARATTLSTDDYLSKFEFKDIVSNAPPLKEMFIRVMLEWSSFSNFLKSKMIDVMNELFQERRLFDQFLRTSDVISLGPVSVISNRLRWLKENSELSSLFVRAKYESLISGQSKSLARIVCTLEYLINFLHPRNGSTDFVIRKTQNIVRQLGLFKDVMNMWSLVHYLNKMGKKIDTPTIRLKSALVTFLLFFVRRNTSNSRELSKYLEPSHYVMTVMQYPSFLRQLNNFSHLAIRDVTRLLVHILNLVHLSDSHLISMCFFERLMIDKNGTLKRTTQNIASTLLSEKLSESLGKVKDRPLYIAALLENLALSAEDNTPVITQCRHLLSFSHLQEMMQTETNLTLLSALCYYLYAVYVKKVPIAGRGVQTLETVGDIADIIENLIDIACDKMKNPIEILNLAKSGSYSLVYFTRNPAYTELQINLSQGTPDLVSWTFLCKDSDGRQSGVLKYILDILEIVELDETTREPMCRLYRGVSQCIGKLEAIRLQTVDLLSISPLLQVFESTRTRLRALLEKVGEEELLFEPIERTQYPISPIQLQDLRSVLSGSIDFSADTGESDALDVDILMSKVLKTGYLQFVKIFNMETEDDYIASIVKLIDSRLFSGSKLTKKEVKDLILTLRAKIRPLQKLFTSSSQRALFFKILKGIVPSEEMAAFKILLNPLFLDIDLVGSALTAILRHESNDEVLAALSLLRKLFILQSREFMDAFRLSLNENAWAYPLFMKIQNELIRAKAYIFEQVTLSKTPALRTSTDLMADKLTKTKQLDELEGEKTHKIVIRMLKFIQICCDNCNEPFQVFCHTQMNTEGKADVDMVTAVANFLIDIRAAGDTLYTNPAIYKMLNASLEVLVDFVTGPCLTNQLLLGNNVRIYLVMNSLIAQSQGKCEDSYIEVHSNCINFLCTLLEGHPNPSVPETMSKFLNIAMLRKGCEDVYGLFIKGSEEALSLELASIGELHISVVENAIQQAILLIKMKHAGVVHEEITRFEANEKDPRFSYGFYQKYIGYVEVDRNGLLESHFFRIPWKCKYLTSSTRNHVLVSVNRASHQEKIKDFLAKVPLCKLEMQHQQILWCSKTFKTFSVRWAAFGRYSYYIALWINIVLLCSIEKSDFSDLKGNFWAFTAVAIMGIIQIGCYMASFFFNLVEYYPQALAASMPKPKEFEMEDFPRVVHSDSQMMLGLHATLTTNNKPDYATALQLKLKQTLFNFELYYTYTYFLISIIAVYEPVFYSFLLLDMIKQTPELINVLRSVTQNFRQLVLTMWLGVILIYLFTIGAFVYFSSYYDEKEGLFCGSLLDCFWTTLNRGIRDNGDFLENPSQDDYWSRMLFDMMFYLIIIIILLNIIFGIIIDTFAELRDQRTQVLEDIHNKCYICGKDRSVIELKSTSAGGWSFHFMREHSLFAYLSFLIYLDEKKIYDCSGLEKHCKEGFVKKDTTFMPSTSLQMERGSDDEEIKATEDD